MLSQILCVALIAVIQLPTSTLAKDRKAITIGDYRELASEAIAKKSIIIRPPKYTIEGGKLHYVRPIVFTGRDESIEDSSDPFWQLMSPMLKIEALRQNPPTDLRRRWRRSWDNHFREAESQVAGVLGQLNSNPNDEKIRKRLEQLEKSVQELLDAAVEEYARRNGVGIVIERLTTGFKVTIKSDPPRAKICMMPELEWRILEKRGKNPEDFLAKRVLTSESVAVEGSWYYLLTCTNGKKSGPSVTTVGLSETLILK